MHIIFGHIREPFNRLLVKLGNHKTNERNDLRVLWALRSTLYNGDQD